MSRNTLYCTVSRPFVLGQKIYPQNKIFKKKLVENGCVSSPLCLRYFIP